MPSLFELLDAQLIITLIGVSIPFVLYVGVRRFGSLSMFWSETRAMFGTPREFAEDTARDVFTPWGSWGRRFTLRGSREIRWFWMIYWLTVLAAYSIVQSFRRF